MKALIDKSIIPVFFLFAASPLLFKLHAIQSVLLVIVSILIIYNTPFKNIKLYKKFIPFIVCFIIITFYMLLFYSNKSFKHIGDSFILFIIPVLSIYTTNKDIYKKYKLKIMLTYCITIAILCCYFIGFYILYIPHHKYNWYIARYFLELNTKIHGTYICLWIAVAIIFSSYYLLKSNLPASKKRYFIPLFIVYVAGIVIFNSRNIMISLTIIGIITAIRYRKHIPVALKAIFAVLIILIFILSQRYIQDIQSLFNSDIYNSSRYIISSCAFETISHSGYLGIDHSLIQDKLSDCYSKFDNEELNNFDLNTHNQYLDYFLKGGFMLFISFILIIGTKIIYSVKTKNNLYFLITMLFAFSFITENVLIRQYGIFIYVLCDILLLGSVLGNEGHTNNKIEESQRG